MSECEICHDITTDSIICKNCGTVLCRVCAVGHRCGK